jgi:glycosyltransferase involved in cell wall biosynthesis
MRTGQNPSKSGIPAYKPQQLGIALLVYIPFKEGYFKNSLDILKFQIESIYKNTAQKFDLLVFDNGSCPEVVHALGELREDGYIEWLVLSKNNLGKVGAWNWIFASMPNELICYADSDVLFRDGWLENSLAILNAFPNVGMVSAQPTFHDVLEGKGRAHLALQEDNNFEFGSYHPDRKIVEEYCNGIGADDKLSSIFFDMDLPCVSNKSNNSNAVIGATHMQFIIPQRVARDVVPLPVRKGLHRAETTSLDRRIDELGYLHLSTKSSYVMHMGNVINEKLLSEVNSINGGMDSGLKSAEVVLSKKSTLFRTISKLMKIPSFQRFFLRVYDFLYRALYAEIQ